MLTKQLVYILASVIALLSILFGVSMYSNYNNNLLAEKKIDTIISEFEEKFKRDSIYLVQANKLYIDKISQKIIDSISSAYEKKSEIALERSIRYEKLLIANNINFDNNNNKINKNNILITNNKKSNIILKNISKPKRSNNVKTYTQLPKHHQKTITNRVSHNNVTTYSELKDYTSQNKHTKNTSNVTTYSKLKNRTPNNKPTKNTSNVTTYSELSKNKFDNSSSNKNPTHLKARTNSSNISHNNYILDKAININNIDFVPTFTGCENIIIEKDKKNCFATKISQIILNNFNNSKVQKSGLKKGIHKVRALFVINKDGYTKLGKLVGEWPQSVYAEVKKSVESTPKMKPGIYNNKPTPVKFSLLIPFIIKN